MSNYAATLSGRWISELSLVMIDLQGCVQRERPLKRPSLWPAGNAAKNNLKLRAVTESPKAHSGRRGTLQSGPVSTFSRFTVALDAFSFLAVPKPGDRSPANVLLPVCPRSLTSKDASFSMFQIGTFHSPNH